MPELEGLWTGSKDAVRHAAVLARIGVWALGVRVRARLARLFAMLVVAAIVVAIAVTAAVWTTARLLGDLSAMLGGGFLGAVLAAAMLLAFMMMLGYVWGLLRLRTRAAKWRDKLDPAASREQAHTPAQEEVDRLRKYALRQLDHDKQQMMQHGSAIWRMHPLASLGVGTASGFFVGRWLLATPRKLRRRAVGVLRLARSMGIASMANSALHAFGMKNPAAPKGPSDRT